MQTDNTVSAFLAPLRAYAKLAPLERPLDPPTEILCGMVVALRGADPRVIAHVTEALSVLMPRLYDLWDAAAHVRYHNPKATWLAPLASAGIAPDGWDYEAYPEGPEPMGSDLDDGFMLSVLRSLN